MNLNEMMSQSDFDNPFNFVVVNLEGNLVTTSIQIAEYFEKNHKEVLRDIRNILENCSEDFTERNFAPSNYIDSTGRTLPMYELTKNGFAMLAMGYTGTKAMKFKVAYINAFDKMAEQLRKNNESALQRVEWVTQRTVEREMEKTRKALLEELRKQNKQK